MGVLSWLRSSLGSIGAIGNSANPRMVHASGAMPLEGRSSSISLITEARNWEAAETTEENAHQWWNATGQPINQVLVDHYDRICNRSTLEARRNPTVEGVIKTHATDVVGDSGPGLVMMTDDDAWNSEAESIFAELANCVDGSGSLSLGEWLRQDMYQRWVSGDMICQIVDDRDAKTAVKTRIHPINPNRLRSPWAGQLSQNLILGIERNNLNRPTTYWFTDEIKNEFGYVTNKYTPVPARDIMHWFESLEPGQVRGWPLLASCLQCISDLREYDGAVLDAAKVQAMMAVLMYTNPNNQMTEAEENPADVKLKKMGITRLPVGWQAAPMATSHPSSNNSEFRKERSRDLGRPAGMPLMQIRLDSSGHNYSSARFDAQTYQNANRIIQGSLGRHRVYPLVELFLIEAMRRGILKPKLFSRQDVSFRWPQPPHVDPVKEAMAERIRLENRTLSPQAACASHNLDFDKVVKDFEIANKLLKAAGMPEMLGGIPVNLAQLIQYLNGGTDPNGQANQSSTNETTAA